MGRLVGAGVFCNDVDWLCPICQPLVAPTSLYLGRHQPFSTALDQGVLVTRPKGAGRHHHPDLVEHTGVFFIHHDFDLMGTTDKAAELVREIPFSQATPILVFEFKILVLIAIFVYAFFRFSWSMRQYTFVALMIGALPSPEFFAAQPDKEDDYAQRVSAMTGLAAETFNDGLRAYYFSFAVMGWFFSPMAFVLTTLLIVAILYNREFRSDVLGVLNDGN